ncbi:Sec-independent protein translocase protein TatB [Sediminicurvatus halobius]|uniref:Sec-independent protein translocase protein TatB n=1 Tax=Sediminicurvatus halobius TaxID=2182432 RepID=A0A2U2MZM0_9GAMM|nr:Sec-independent protein translocase protein TatB [Spiribacter halobius]PWG62247.1 twin-arginine translocase subunit TatB [Spiribacter halobius]UEX78158.1 Sec-independent protein translocase protein TatB [Spiribacter halobius]
MFDVSFWELLIIGVVALVVVGPERLPGLMRTVGLWVGKARASFQSIRDEVEREVHAEGLRDTQRALQKQARETERQVRDAVDSGESRARVQARSPGDTGAPAAGATEAGSSAADASATGGEEPKAGSEAGPAAAAAGARKPAAGNESGQG